MSDFKAKMQHNSTLAGAPPQTTLEKLTALPLTLAGLRCLLLSESKGEKGRKSEEKGKEGGIAPMFLGGIHAPGLKYEF